MGYTAKKIDELPKSKYPILNNKTSFEFMNLNPLYIIMIS